MDKYVTQVKRHKHKNKYQYLITFTGEHGFEYEEPVIVIKESDFNKFEKEFTSSSNQDALHRYWRPLRTFMLWNGRIPGPVKRGVIKTNSKYL